MVERVALDVQRHQAVDPRRLDAAPGAIGVLMAHDPFRRMGDGGGAPEAEPLPLAELLQAVQHLVGAAEEGVPAAGVPLLRQRVVELGAAAGEQGVEPAVGGQGAARAPRREQGDRHEGRPRPLGEIVDREREPQREPDHLRRQVRRFLPRPFADQRQPVAGEDADVAQAALGLDPAARLDQGGLVVAMPERAQGGVGFHRGVDVAILGVVVDLPGPVGALGLQQRLTEAGAQGVILQTQKPQREAPLRLHATVAFRARDPMAIGLLVGDQPFGGRAGGAGERGVEIVGGAQRVHGARYARSGGAREARAWRLVAPLLPSCHSEQPSAASSAFRALARRWAPGLNSPKGG